MKEETKQQLAQQREALSEEHQQEIKELKEEHEGEIKVDTYVCSYRSSMLGVMIINGKRLKTFIVDNTEWVLFGNLRILPASSLVCSQHKYDIVMFLRALLRLCMHQLGLSAIWS